MTTNKIFIPPYYYGTSYQDIIDSLKYSINKYSLPIEFIGNVEPRINKAAFNNFDDLDDIYEYSIKLFDSKNLKNTEKILFIDFFSPGLDMLKYIISIKNQSIKLGSLLHGGTFVPGDLYQWPWLSKSEDVWFEFFDTIYVPSKYTKSLIPNYKNKIKALSWGMDHIKNIQSNKKNNTVLFPHRLEDDKGIDNFI
jgi:hypothetical protein